VSVRVQRGKARVEEERENRAHFPLSLGLKLTFTEDEGEASVGREGRKSLGDREKKGMSK